MEHEFVQARRTGKKEKVTRVCDAHKYESLAHDPRWEPADISVDKRPLPAVQDRLTVFLVAVEGGRVGCLAHALKVGAERRGRNRGYPSNSEPMGLWPWPGFWAAGCLGSPGC